jgi:hypothetical protein
MDPSSALEQIKKSCNAISAELMRLHPPTNALADQQIRDEMFKALFELTKQLETIKKLARKVELKSAGEQNPALPPEL